VGQLRSIDEASERGASSSCAGWSRSAPPKENIRSAGTSPTRAREAAVLWENVYAFFVSMPVLLGGLDTRNGEGPARATVWTWIRSRGGGTDAVVGSA